MYLLIVSLLQDMGLNEYTGFIAPVICVIAAAVACVLLRWLAKLLLIKMIRKINERKNIPFISIGIENKLFLRLSDFAIPFVISVMTAGITDSGLLLNKATDVLLIVIVLRAVNACVKSVGMIYAERAASKTIPIHSVLQVFNVAAFILGGIAIISIMVNKSPVVLLGSIGAMTAITSVVFKDAIVGFIAGIQLTGYDMIRIGDWVELPKHSANGTVVEVSMTTVKVENFDKSITMIPAYSLVTDAFINWRGIFNTGARRIKRSILIDAASIRVCDEEGLAHLRKIPLLASYITRRSPEPDGAVCTSDLEQPRTGGDPIPVNIGLFRIYVTEYLRHHPGIRQDLALIVRQLEQSADGIPLEIYGFVNTTVWVEYENTQSDIFEHLYTIVKEFGLRLYQNPAGSDLRVCMENNRPTTG